MKLDNYHPPKSSFLSVEKDFNLIINAMLSDQRLGKLLLNESRDCLSGPALTQEQMNSLVGKYIKFIPKIYVEPDKHSYILISFDNFVLNKTNPEFRDNIIEFDILCHIDSWELSDTFQLRPYRIAAEIDTLFNNKHLTGIGSLHFISADEIVENDEFFGLCVKYAAIHGEEDKKGMLNPEDDEVYAEDFSEMIHYN